MKAFARAALMAGLFSIIALFGGVTSAEPLTPRAAADLLGASVVGMERGSNVVCTAAKIGPKTFLSAGHCAGAVDASTKLSKDWTYHYVRSITVTTQKKADGSRREDWMVINTTVENEDMPALELGCAEEIYIGMPIAYAGYPYPIRYGMGLGHVMSIKSVNGGRNNLDFVIDVHAAPGASGSPVISLDSGKIIGVLTEGVPSRVGFFAVGIEHIGNLDICEDRLAGLKDAEDKIEAVLGNSDHLSSPF